MHFPVVTSHTLTVLSSDAVTSKLLSIQAQSFSPNVCGFDKVASFWPLLLRNTAHVLSADADAKYSPHLEYFSATTVLVCASLTTVLHV